VPHVNPRRTRHGHFRGADLPYPVKHAINAPLNVCRKRAVFRVQGADDEILGVAMVADNIRLGPVHTAFHDIEVGAAKMSGVVMTVLSMGFVDSLVDSFEGNSIA